jgi:acetyltransferase-like isoleucine patch superfamily enzyme
MIMPGVTIGRGSIVMAGTVVTGDVPPNTIVGGNPARQVRRLAAEASAQ